MFLFTYNETAHCQYLLIKQQTAQFTYKREATIKPQNLGYFATASHRID